MAPLGTFIRRLGRRRTFATVASLLVPADRLIGRLTGGRVVALGLVPSLLLVSTGRKSGLRRTNPLLYIRDGDSYVVVGSNWGKTAPPAWALNLRAQPFAWVIIKGAAHAVRARLVDGQERERLWRLLVAEWPAYPDYVARAGGRDIPIFRLEPRLREPSEVAPQG